MLALMGRRGIRLPPTQMLELELIQHPAEGCVRPVLHFDPGDYTRIGQLPTIALRC